MRALYALCLISYGACQQTGDAEEAHLSMAMSQCDKSGCKPEATKLVMDLNWRWLHNKGGYKNCLKKDGSGWDASICKSPADCAQKCAIEGVSSKSYTEDYGVTLVKDGVKLDFPKGPRLYVMDTDTSYKLFNLKNREFTFDVDLSTLPCGVNAAIYFVEMSKNGAMDGKLNAAGAKYGTGYCDAQCPHMRFLPGIGANSESWKKHMAKTPDGKFIEVGPDGPHGLCCAEMDILEANRHATAWTVHPCNVEEQKVCTGDKECGNMDKALPGYCDKGGCGWNPYRLGNPKFFGAGAGFALDTSKPFTVVTQFVTDDGTDEGDLAEVRQAYAQNGKVIPNPETDDRLDGAQTMTDALCDKMTTAYQTNKSEPVRNDFKKLGGLASMGSAMDRGMVLALSIWDDDFGRMLWLDGEKTTAKEDGDAPGVARGPCPFNNGNDKDIQAKAKTSPVAVTFSKLKFGPLGSTSPLTEVPKFTPPAEEPATPAATHKKPASGPPTATEDEAGAAPSPEPAPPAASTPAAPPSPDPSPAPAPPPAPAPAPPPAPAPAPPAAPPAPAPAPPAAPAAASYTAGCDWIPKDNCKETDAIACKCRELNPSGPCTTCPNPHPKQAQAAWTDGCEWIPKDNCQKSDEFACKCRASNPTGPCTPCPNSHPKQAPQRKFEEGRGGAELGGSPRLPPAAAAAVLASAVVAFVAFAVVKRRRSVTRGGIGAVPLTSTAAADEETSAE